MTITQKKIVRLPAPTTHYLLRVDGADSAQPPTIAPIIHEPTKKTIALGLNTVSASTMEKLESMTDVPHLSADVEARERGYQEGLKAGETKWQQRVDRLNSIVEEMERAKVESNAQLETEAVAIAFEAIAKILGQKQARESAIAEAVEHALRANSGREPITVRVSPDDYEALLVEPALVILEDERGAIRLLEDPRVTMGGCYVESIRGTLDARLETQINRLKSVLVEVYGAASGNREIMS